MNFALLDDNLSDNSVSYIFEDPVNTVVCFDHQRVHDTLNSIDQSVRQGGLYACGYVAYEAAAGFGFPVNNPTDTNQPLIYFGLFKTRRAVTNTEVDAALVRRARGQSGGVGNLTCASNYFSYCTAISQIRSELERGKTYQVNYTFRYHGKLTGDAICCYQNLRKAQPVAYGAYLEVPNGQILSRSPELFFKKTGCRLTVAPMKGTAPRNHSSHQADNLEKNKLKADPKQQSENVMIVDLLRNDLGRIANPGTVEVEKLFSIESYKTVHQMTSTISCNVADETALLDIFSALFPCGSVTGAPKLSTCQIIAQLEDTPRHVYTGAIGHMSPDGDMCFNVPIRTLEIDPDRNTTLGVGSGIVYESDALAEYTECRLKTAFIAADTADFGLIEAFRFSVHNGLVHFDRHMKRLINAAKDLGFPLDVIALKRDVEQVCSGLNSDHKVRIELRSDGSWQVSIQALSAANNGPKQAILSNIRTDGTNRCWRYKTTDRDLYDTERANLAAQYGVYDVLFANTDGFLTEGSYHNVVLRFGDRYLTPCLECGLLNGVGRDIFLEKYRGSVTEDFIPISDIIKADQVLLVSSVRGIVPVEVIEHGR